MHTHLGHIKEIVLAASGQAQARITCPPSAVPQPGQYVLAWSPEEHNASLAAALFPAQVGESEFLGAPPLFETWQPGMELRMHSPRGRGFNIPGSARRIIIAAYEESPARVLPLIDQALDNDVSAALFADCALPALPPAIEIYPLKEIPSALTWADFIAVDISIDSMDILQNLNETISGSQQQPPTQVLVYGDMPCGGIAECGVCAVPGARKIKLACKDGPVFDMKEIS